MKVAAPIGRCKAGHARLVLLRRGFVATEGGGGVVAGTLESGAGTSEVPSGESVVRRISRR